MKILFAGEGGQGVQVIAEILAKASFFEGKHALHIPNFGTELRGGISLAFVTVNDQPVVYPKFEKADILAILAGRSLPRVKQYLASQTKVILGPAVSGPVRAEEIKVKSDHCPPKTWNMAVLGKVNQVGKIVSFSSLVKAMDERFAGQFRRNPNLRNQDLEALKT